MADNPRGCNLGFLLRLDQGCLEQKRYARMRSYSCYLGRYRDSLSLSLGRWRLGTL